MNWLRKCRLAFGDTVRPAHALLVLAMGVAVGLAGCDIPRSGPMASEIQQNSENPGDFPFRLVPVDVAVSGVLLRAPDDSMSTRGFFRSDRKSGGPVLGPGDSLSITVMEPASGGVFTGINSQNVGGQSAALVTLPDMTVDTQGTIAFPLVGSVHVAGMTTRQVASKLEEELKSRIIQPQVLVRLSGNLTNKVIIAGAVKSPGEFDVTAAGETLLQLVTRAGGPVVPPSDAVVELTRSGTTRSVRLQALINQPTADVKLAGGDFINIAIKPRIYLIMGAIGRTTEAALPPEKLTLANALARNGGFIDSRADVKGVFVLRYEPQQVISQLTPDQPADTPYVPVVYQFNFEQTSGFFLSDSFVLRDRDIIYLSNASSVEMQKFLDVFRIAVSPAISAVGVAANVNNL
ncbi:polysaccharide biosynthesis/export family protein [Xanthobacter agilis]|uniref:Polysaccharide export outer membrane protein n=1 Tax=Xanthobacter agilis TaxID=47492 RepID=A0ABU0LC28_XANAG|nr:polysaccharide biosynthesis/export family protein [Xanthobacter agilis]MDQ0504702.1 polysaccharide export outer membrane protein [Xanthobacter agilis]